MARDLERFQAEFGKLSERMEQASHTELDRVELPKAERDGIATPQPAKEQNNRALGADDYKFLPDKQVSPDFKQAVGNETAPDKNSGRGSNMVEKDSSQLNNRPPPEIAKSTDQRNHNYNMTKDDNKAKDEGAKNPYQALAQKQNANGEYDKYKTQGGQERERGLDQQQDQDRSNSFER